MLHLALTIPSFDYRLEHDRVSCIAGSMWQMTTQG